MFVNGMRWFTMLMQSARLSSMSHDRTPKGWNPLKMLPIQVKSAGRRSADESVENQARNGREQNDSRPSEAAS